MNFILKHLVKKFIPSSVVTLLRRYGKALFELTFSLKTKEDWPFAPIKIRFIAEKSSRGQWLILSSAGVENYVLTLYRQILNERKI